MKHKQAAKRRKTANPQARTYDKTAKHLIATRQTLAMILHERVPEFHAVPLDTIEQGCIEGTPWIEEIPVAPGRTNRKRRRPQKIRGLSAEQSDEGEGYITFDVLFYARVPGTGKRIKLLINIEAQRSSTDYELYHRAWFYLCRLVSSQKGYDFEGQDYDGICKVYSIWLCFYLPEGEKSSITSYDTRENTLVGNHTKPKSIYDLFSIIMVHVGDEESEDTLLEFLRLIFLAQLTEKELSKKLQDEFGFQPNDETRKELENMCNLSKGLTERAEAQGITQGIAQATLKIIKRQLKRKADYAQIAEDTDTPIDEVIRIAKENHLAY